MDWTLENFKQHSPKTQRKLIQTAYIKFILSPKMLGGFMLLDEETKALISIVLGNFMNGDLVWNEEVEK